MTSWHWPLSSSPGPGRRLRTPPFLVLVTSHMQERACLPLRPSFAVPTAFPAKGNQGGCVSRLLPIGCVGGRPCAVSGLRAVEWHPRLLYARGKEVALGLAPESLQAVDLLVDTLLATYHGSLSRASQAPKLLLMTPHNNTVPENWPTVLQDVPLLQLLMARMPVEARAHAAKDKAKATAEAIDRCFEKLRVMDADVRAQLLPLISPAKVSELRRLRPTLFHQFLECTNTVKATGMTGTVSIVVVGKDTRFLYFGAEAEARFNVSLTRAKAIAVVVAPPSSTGRLGMLQTASARLPTPPACCLALAPALRTLMKPPGTGPTTLAARRPFDVCPSVGWSVPQNR